MDHNYLKNLPDETYRRMHWYATHFPRPLCIADLPDDDFIRQAWDKLSFYKNDKKVFPLYHWYKFACQKFGMPVQSNYSPGIPADISKQLSTTYPTNSCTKIYTYLYTNSYYSSNMKCRICEISYGLIKQSTLYSFRSIARAFDFLRHHRFIRQIWRGRPDPDDQRYLHSCYELPTNYKHILHWRINKFKRIKKG